MHKASLSDKIKQANAEVTSLKRQMKEATDRAIAARPEGHRGDVLSVCGVEAL